MAGLEGERRADQVARIKFPDAGAVRQDPADRGRAVEVLRLARGLHRRRPGHRQGQPGGHPRPQRRRQDHAAADPRPASTSPTPARSRPGHGLKLGYYAQEHETLDTARTVLENMQTAAPAARPTPRPAAVLGSFLFSGDDVDKPAGVLSGGEKTRLALAILVVSSANVLLLDEPTNNLDPASREEVLAAIRSYAGRDRAGHPRRGRRRGARARPGADPARRRRGPLERGLRRPGRRWPEAVDRSLSATRHRPRRRGG